MGHNTPSVTGEGYVSEPSKRATDMNEPVPLSDTGRSANNLDDPAAGEVMPCPRSRHCVPVSKAADKALPAWDNP